MSFLPRFLTRQPAKRGEHPASRMLDVAGRSLPLTVREHARATRMTLRIEPGAKGLRLTIPRGLPEREIDRFVARHEGWIESRLADYADVGSLSDGGTIPVRGVDHVIRRTGKLRGLTRAASDGEFAVLTVGGMPEHLGRRVADFLKREARRDLEEAVARHAQAAGATARTIRMKDTKSRWGSCSSDGNLSFSWRIVMAPPFVIDYLAAHEVAHLKEMNHGPRFWALCRRLAPRTDEAKAWLKRHGGRLQGYEFR